MITLKTPAEIMIMREAGRIAAQSLLVGGELVRPGVTTGEIDRAMHDFIVSQGAVPTCLGYCGFPKTACISVNNVVIHGIPGKQVLSEGDIVSIDVCATYKGFVGDTAYTFPCGRISPEAQRLLDVTKESLRLGIQAAQAGSRLGDVSHAVQEYVEGNGFSVVRDYTGHGIGREMHEAPEVPNYGHPGRGARLLPGMAFTVEPMVNQKGFGVTTDRRDGWTVRTNDGGLSAHFEHTLAITDRGPIVLTEP